MMTIWTIKCTKCNDVIYSRTRHDMRWCSCGEIAIDGGFDYTKITGSCWEVSEPIELAATKEELHNDWANGDDKYGRIAKESS